VLSADLFAKLTNKTACELWSGGRGADGEKVESREPRAESREQRAESREQRAESREQRAESREQIVYTSKTACEWWSGGL
jgi:hypothetical protein